MTRPDRACTAAGTRAVGRKWSSLYGQRVSQEAAALPAPARLLVSLRHARRAEPSAGRRRRGGAVRHVHASAAGAQHARLRLLAVRSLASRSSLPPISALARAAL